MHLFKSIKKNISAYLLHFVFVCIVAPLITGVSFGLIEFISGDRALTELMISMCVTSLFAIIYGSIISVPLAFVSLFLFKWLMDAYEGRAVYFCVFGAIFGALTHNIFFYLGEWQEIEIFLTLVLVGILTGYLLNVIWHDSYTKRIAT